MLNAGYPLSAVTKALCARWQPGVDLLPMTDDRVETHVVIADPAAEGGRRAVHFQEYWVRLHAPTAYAVLPVGAADATPAPGVLAAVTDADLVILPPSNPVVSIGTILAIPGVADALRSTPARVVGVSPIIAGAPLRGMADRLLPVIGVDVTAAAVGLHYGARSNGGLIDGWLVDVADQDAVAVLEADQVAARAVPLVMADLPRTAAIASAAVDLVGLHGRLDVTDAGDASRHPPLEVWAVAWPEIRPGDDLTGLVCAIDGLRDGDIVIVTSKVVSKAEGRRVIGDRTRLDRGRDPSGGRPARPDGDRGDLPWARPGSRRRRRLQHPSGYRAPSPVASGPTARRLRDGVQDANGVNVAVVVSDTAGRAWRLGQTDIAIGCAGLQPLVDLQGTRDTHGNQLLVTAPAIADELAAASELVKQKATGRPVAVARGLAELVLPPGEDGPGASALVRQQDDDLFGLAAREAVLAAAHRTDLVALDHFPRRVADDADPFDGLVEGWLRSLSTEQRDQVRLSMTRGACADTSDGPAWALAIAVRDDAEAPTLVAAGRLLERAETLGASQRLAAHDHPQGEAPPGWRLVAARCWQDR